MQDTQIYSFFLDKGPNSPAIFLFRTKLIVNFRPTVGDSVTNPLTLQNFRIMRDEIDESQQAQRRVTGTGLVRITDDGLVRITIEQIELDKITHSYIVTPANNPNRISSYTTSGFANDQTLKQLFR